MRTRPHSGFSVDQSVYLPAGDKPGIERLVGYMTRCPFSPSRLVTCLRAGKFSPPPIGSRAVRARGGIHPRFASRLAGEFLG